MIIYVVVFPPNTGGNHLSNLILTTASNVISNNLNEYYLNGINSASNAHGNVLVNSNVKLNNMEIQSSLQRNKIVEYVQQFDTHCSIAGHLDEAFYTYPILKKLGEVVFINVEIDDITSVRRNNVHAEPDHWLYRYDKIAKLFNVHEEEVMDIPLSMLWNDNVTMLLDKLSKGPDANYMTQNSTSVLDFNLNQCQMMHNKWLSMFDGEKIQ